MEKGLYSFPSKSLWVFNPSTQNQDLISANGFGPPNHGLYEHGREDRGPPMIVVMGIRVFPMGMLAGMFTPPSCIGGVRGGLGL